MNIYFLLSKFYSLKSLWIKHINFSHWKTGVIESLCNISTQANRYLFYFPSSLFKRLAKIRELLNVQFSS